MDTTKSNRNNFDNNNNNNNNNTNIYRGRPQALKGAFHEGPLMTNLKYSTEISHE